jgi:hypothetical protein
MKYFTKLGGLQADLYKIIKPLYEEMMNVRNMHDFKALVWHADPIAPHIYKDFLSKPALREIIMKHKAKYYPKK